MGQKVFGYDTQGWLGGAQIGGASQSKKLVKGTIYVIGAKKKRQTVLNTLKKTTPAWQWERANQSSEEMLQLISDTGPVWVIHPNLSRQSHHDGILAKSQYASARTLVGALCTKVGSLELDELIVSFEGAEDEEILGSLVGLEMASYRYLNHTEPKKYPHNLPKIRLVGATAAQLKEALVLGVSVNLARHLVNTPAGDLNPKTYAAHAKKMYVNSKSMKVDVWSGKRLEKEKMGLLMAVGKGSEEGPCLIHFKYRPTGASGKKPLAFVGKGVTFDTGGLNIKPGGGMRLMKKDMGGSASLFAFAYWLEQTKAKFPCDIYLAVAENSLDERSFRPGDVIMSRAGISVEIDNTDAEGRLVMADALDVAAKKTGKDEPEAIIDLATLTGAMRIALGTKVGGLLSNQDKLSNNLISAGQKMGDPIWRMPLVQDYSIHLYSEFADLSNSANTRFGGGITAALFLARFMNGKPFAHIDMMAWADLIEGPYAEKGGNGQCVQALASFVQDWRK
jgi:leucyl aminopeptidase